MSFSIDIFKTDVDTCYLQNKELILNKKTMTEADKADFSAAILIY